MKSFFGLFEGKAIIKIDDQKIGFFVVGFTSVATNPFMRGI